MYYNSQRSDIYCAMVDLSKVYDRINASLLCDKMRESELPGQVIALIDFMCINTLSALLIEANCVMIGMLEMECDRGVFHMESYSISILLKYYLTFLSFLLGAH